MGEERREHGGRGAPPFAVALAVEALCFVPRFALNPGWAWVTVLLAAMVGLPLGQRSEPVGPLGAALLGLPAFLPWAALRLGARWLLWRSVPGSPRLRQAALTLPLMVALPGWGAGALVLLWASAGGDDPVAVLGYVPVTLLAIMGAALGLLLEVVLETMAVLSGREGLPAPGPGSRP